MDHFNVPKKVNRHVLKALGALSGGDRNRIIVTSSIINQVKYQMRNLVPVPNLERAVQNSLKNLSEIGLIDRRGMHRYALGRSAAAMQGPSAQSNSKTPDRRVFRGNDPRRCSRSRLDPNMKRGRACSEEESLSGDEFDRTRKRMRTNNKQLGHCGRWAHLPRVRQHHQKIHPADQLCRIRAPIDTPLISQDLYSIHHQQTILQECFHPKACRDPLGIIISGMISNATSDHMLANVTPALSLEIAEISDDVKKIVDVRKIVETPPLQQQNEKELEMEEYEEREEGVQTENISSTAVSDHQNATTCRETASKVKQAVQKVQNASKIITNQNPVTKIGLSHRAMTTSNALAATSENSSKSLLPDYTKSYIK
ncbi:PREDICTED: uncharacterized protein LOC108364172 [Rhagoletis zephyria]|uniref:uncharacterized protein LOC108364172 n=1 Tax=Rhagoletis zephyria TaxID=28612 RepID=UPI000811268A|nr:PREDICTED: uncharacterized protein LOC108364172 [Rhagoletis zephyria]